MNQERLMNIIIAPVVSEKGTMLADKYRQFVFKVAKSATKPEIKQAIELLFNVKVNKVRVTKVPGKPKRHGQIQGRTKAWKKAIVGLQDGYDIDFAGAE